MSLVNVITNPDEKVNIQAIKSISSAVHLHFNPDSSYNGFQFRFKRKGENPSRSEYEKDPLKYKYEQIYKRVQTRNDVVLYCMANILAGATFIREYSDAPFERWLGGLQNIGYAFEQDIEAIKKYLEKNKIAFNEFFVIKGSSQVPPIYTEELNINTLATLDTILRFTDDQKKLMQDPLKLLHNYIHKVQAYSPFIRPFVDGAKVAQTVLGTFK